MNKAGQECQGAYEIVSQNGESAGAFATPAGNGYAAVNAIHREMIIECKAAK